MNEELVARMERAFTDFNEAFEKQVDRIVNSFDQSANSEENSLLREIRDHVRDISFATQG